MARNRPDSVGALTEEMRRTTRPVSAIGTRAEFSDGAVRVMTEDMNRNLWPNLCRMSDGLSLGIVR
jgi:hypothetical protein